MGEASLQCAAVLATVAKVRSAARNAHAGQGHTDGECGNEDDGNHDNHDSNSDSEQPFLARHSSRSGTVPHHTPRTKGDFVLGARQRNGG